ncbi:MAG: type II toxin-antitoxin system HipA family toxin [Bdellovibrio sp.]
MAKKSSSIPLNIYLNGLFVGTLAYPAQKNLSFHYSDFWLSRSSSFPISRSLPLREQPYVGNEIYAYFDNLLPDNVSIRQRIAARMKAESDHVFDLLTVVGRDCVGALQFIRADEPPPHLEKVHGTPLTQSAIAERIRRLHNTPLATSTEDNFRLSIAGAQEKTAFLKVDNKWYIPQDATPTTHILKPPMGEIQKGLNFADSIENEWLCSKIVRAFGIPVANCEIVHFDDVKVLSVKRFDRTWLNSDILIRIPQEDLCQAFGVASFEKYQTDGGPGIVQIMDILNESLQHEDDRKNFLKSQVVFLLLAAIDGHAKNFSLRWGPAGFIMTPLYDILSAQPFIDSEQFQEEKIKMAMSFGDKNYYRVRDISRRHFLQTAKSCRISSEQMELILDEVLAEVPSIISRVTSELPSDFPQHIADSIFAGMQKRTRQIRGD